MEWKLLGRTKKLLLRRRTKLQSYDSKKARPGSFTKTENSCKILFVKIAHSFSRNFDESEIRIGVVWRTLCLDDENQYQEWRKNRNNKSSQDAVEILKKKLEADGKTALLKAVSSNFQAQNDLGF